MDKLKSCPNSPNAFRKHVTSITMSKKNSNQTDHCECIE